MAQGVAATKVAPQQSADAGCRFCGGELSDFVDLGMSPLCESFVPADRLNSGEMFYPLAVKICRHCFLAQLAEYVAPGEIFSEYAYFSSYSDAYLEHARSYVEMITERLGLGEASRVVELASNDGYLLQYFVAKGIPVLGIEPAANVAKAAEARGVRTLVRFFGADEARNLISEGYPPADLIIGNNVLAQVPDLNSFVEGIRVLLAARGVATIEFPDLMTLLDQGLYDTIYHEHFSYFSFSTAERVFAAHGLRVFDVERIWTHGGSLRLYVCHSHADSHPDTPHIAEQRRRETQYGLGRYETYAAFADMVKRNKWELLEFLIGARRQGKTVVGYGAPGKGNTLLNYCGIRTDLIDYTVDRNPYKHGRFLPGSHIPIFPPGRIAETRPDYVLILPWNLKHEIMEQLAFVREWGGQFVVPIPTVTVHG